MIEKFKKSRLGQMLIAAFATASVVAVIVTWLYESIRIPTLTSQSSFQENKIKSLEEAVLDEKEEIKELSANVENEKLESAKWRTSAKQSADEINQVGEKLRDAI